MKNIVLLGASLNSGNKGVNALTRSQIMLILDKYGYETEITILSYTVSEDIENIISYENKEKKILEVSCNKKKIIKSYINTKLKKDDFIINYLQNADFIFDISEGDSFSDIYGLKRFFQHSALKIVSINNKAKLILMPQTLGPFKRGIAKKVAKRIINKCDVVFTRDEISKEIVEHDLKVNKKINVVPDIAFYMKPNEKVNIHNFINNNNEVIGLNISALLYNGGYNRNNMFELKADYCKFIDLIIEEIMNIENVNLILIPHVMVEDFEVEDDFKLCEKIANKYKQKYQERIYSIDKHYREDEIKSIISGCNFFIGSRMHACIGAASTLVPTVPIAYSRKFRGVWEKISLEWCVLDPKEKDEKELVTEVIKLYENKNKIKDTLELEIPKLKQEIESIINIIEGEN